MIQPTALEFPSTLDPHAHQVSVEPDACGPWPFTPGTGGSNSLARHWNNDCQMRNDYQCIFRCDFPGLRSKLLAPTDRCERHSRPGEIPINLSNGVARKIKKKNRAGTLIALEIHRIEFR